MGCRSADSYWKYSWIWGMGVDRDKWGGWGILKQGKGAKSQGKGISRQPEGIPPEKEEGAATRNPGKEEKGQRFIQTWWSSPFCPLLFWTRGQRAENLILSFFFSEMPQDPSRPWLLSFFLLIAEYQHHDRLHHQVFRRLSKRGSHRQPKEGRGLMDRISGKSRIKVLSEMWGESRDGYHSAVLFVSVTGS